MPVPSSSLELAPELDSGRGSSECAGSSVDVERCRKGSGMNFQKEICHNRGQTSHVSASAIFKDQSLTLCHIQQTDEQPRPMTVIDLLAHGTNVLDSTTSDTNDQLHTTRGIDLADAFLLKHEIGAHGTNVLDYAASDRSPSVYSEADLADAHAQLFDEDETREDKFFASY